MSDMVLCSVCGQIVPRANDKHDCVHPAYKRGFNDALEAVAKWHDVKRREYRIWAVSAPTAEVQIRFSAASNEHELSAARSKTYSR